MSFLVMQYNYNPNQQNPFTRMGLQGGILEQSFNQGTQNALLNQPTVGTQLSADEQARQEEEKKRRRQQGFDTANKVARGIGTGLEVVSNMMPTSYDYFAQMEKPRPQYQHIGATGMPIVDLAISGAAMIPRYLNEKAAFDINKGMATTRADIMNQQMGDNFVHTGKYGKYHNPYSAYGYKKKAKASKVTEANFQSEFGGNVDAIERAVGIRQNKPLTPSQELERKRKGAYGITYNNPYMKKKKK